jgi:hypothetical protein
VTKVPEKFPKIRSVYKRTDDSAGNYTVDPVVNDDFKWVFKNPCEVEAVEKIHGTNVAVYINDSKVTKISSRVGDRSMNLVDPYEQTEKHYIVRGVQNSIRRGYTDNLVDGWNFGELVGPSVHQNPYDLDENLYIPFEWLRDKCAYRSYGKYSTEFEDISRWLREEIFSLFYSKMHGKSLEESTVSNDIFVEGIVFIHPEFEGQISPTDLDDIQTDNYDSVTHTICKLRRDMYSWYHDE